MSPALEGHGARGRPRAVRLRYLFLFATIFGGSFFIFSISNRVQIVTFHYYVNPPRNTAPNLTIATTNAYTIKTEGCIIPALASFGKSIEQYVKPAPHLKPCQFAERPLLGNNDTHIWVNDENVDEYEILFNTFSCCYMPFRRPQIVENIDSLLVDKRVEYSNCIYFNYMITVKHEFVKVYCMNHQDKVIYTKYFLFAPKKRLESLNFYKTTQNSIEKRNQFAYNVVVIGIDSVSRLNFHRTMPKTLDFLQKKNSVELLGYNKVGDNTFPNLIPMLLGVSENEIITTCWPSDVSTFDNCPFIWEWYKQAGFYTAFAEDTAELGTFNFGKVGFRGTPTHYYVHTFVNEAESKVANYKLGNMFMCMGDQYFYKFLLDYIERLTRTLKYSKLFGLFWEVTMTHDYLNYPMVMDDDYLKFLQNLDESGYLENTILILLSDHGIRWGEIRLTKQGRLEERLPFVQILLPQSFRDNYNQACETLKLNRRRLTTPYDIHATLSDLTNLNTIMDETLEIRSKKPYAKDRSISLFLPVPMNRTCKMAGIADHWCTCNKGHKLSTQSSEALAAGNALIHHLNAALNGQAQCASLSLAEIVDAHEMVSGDAGGRELLVVARAEPGGGLFEATLSHDEAAWALAGTVSRLNFYGDTSHCVHHYQLKLYCYCT